MQYVLNNILYSIFAYVFLASMFEFYSVDSVFHNFIGFMLFTPYKLNSVCTIVYNV